MNELTAIEQSLIEARDALLEFWDQGEGAVCFIALRIADDALVEYRDLEADTRAEREPAVWERIATLAEEVTRLRVALEGSA